MKNILLTMCAITLTLGLIAETEKVGDITWRYYVEDGVAVLGEKRRYDYQTLYPAIDTSITGEVEVPANLGGYVVGGIGEAAFAGSSFSAITFPETVSYVKMGAFAYAAANTINLPNNVTNIETQAFLAAWDLGILHCQQI